MEEFLRWTGFPRGGWGVAPTPIMVGDFNCVISPLDCRKHYLEKRNMVLADLVRIWIREHFSASRLDRCYVLREEEGIRVLGVSHLTSQADHKQFTIVQIQVAL